MWTLIETKIRNSIVAVIVVYVLGSLGYIAIQRNNIKKLAIENQTLQEAYKNPKIVEKPVVTVRYIERTIKSEPDTLILETIKEVESNGGKTSEPMLSQNQNKPKNWTAGVTYDLDGNVGGLITRRVYKSIEAGIIGNIRTAGVVGTIKF